MILWDYPLQVGSRSRNVVCCLLKHPYVAHDCSDTWQIQIQRQSKHSILGSAALLFPCVQLLLCFLDFFLKSVFLQGEKAEKWKHLSKASIDKFKCSRKKFLKKHFGKAESSVFQYRQWNIRIRNIDYSQHYI